MAEQTLNLPQILAVLLVGFLVLRWFFSSSSAQRGAPAGNRPFNPAHVEQIHQMFPQLDRRAIIWDLHQNGGSVQATTERVLSGRALAQPPPSFRPPLPNSPAPSTARQGQARAPLPDLITKFGLTSKVGADSKGKAPAYEVEPVAATKQSGWSQNKTERSELMRRRKEEMILAARRRMEQQDRNSTGSS